MSLSIAVALIVALALVALLSVGAVLVLRDSEASKRRVEGLFRRAPQPPKPPSQDHYYRPYWS